MAIIITSELFQNLLLINNKIDTEIVRYSIGAPKKIGSALNICLLILLIPFEIR